MMDNRNRLVTVNAMSGNGENWLELNDAMGEGHQTLGIERSVQTVAGAIYTLSLDVAGRVGYSADYTRIGIYVDGVRIGGDDSTSGSNGLNWQTRQFAFTGNGTKQTIRIVSEATRRDANGRGMMLDDLRLTERLPLNTGMEDTAIRLSAITAALVDTDGSETLSVLSGRSASWYMVDRWGTPGADRRHLPRRPDRLEPDHAEPEPSQGL